MTCQTCSHWNLKATPRELHPLARCDMQPKHVYVSRKGECPQHIPISATNQAQRDTWLTKKGFTNG